MVLREAGVLNADQFRIVARRFASVTDPDTDDAEDDKAAAGEFLDLAKTFGGYHVAGFLTDEHGLLVTTAIAAVMGAPSAEDTRTAGQRRAQGLADVARLVLDTNQASPGAAIPPHLNVTVSWTELVAQITRTRDGLCLTCGQTTPARGTRADTAGGTAAEGGADGQGPGRRLAAGWGGDVDGVRAAVLGRSGVHRDRRPGTTGVVAPPGVRQCGHPRRVRARRRRAGRRAGAADRDRADASRGDRPG